MTRFLQNCKKIFGLKIVECRNSDLITPYYLALLMNQTDVLGWFRELEIKLVLPHVQTHNILTYKLIASSTFVDWTCQSHYSIRYSALARIKMIKCLNRYSSSSEKDMNSASVALKRIKFNILMICLFSWIRYNNKKEFEYNRMIEKLNRNTKQIRKYCDQSQGQTSGDNPVNVFFTSKCSRFYRFLSLHILYTNRIRKSYRKRWRNAYDIYEQYLYFGFNEQFFVRQLFCDNINFELTGEKCNVYPFLATTAERFHYMNVLHERNDLHMFWVLLKINLHQVFNYSKFEQMLLNNHEKLLEDNLIAAGKALNSLKANLVHQKHELQVH